MVVVEPEPATLDSRVLTLYYTKDLLLGNLPVVIFHGPSTTTNSTLNTSRIQAHIFSVAGYQSFPRLTISPTSPLYSAVHCLPEEDQGDEISRGLAISLLKYFNEIPEAVRDCIQTTVASGSAENVPKLFDAAHAARLASQMERVENASQVLTHLMTALTARSLSWTDIDVVLPPESIKIHRSGSNGETNEDSSYTSNAIDYGTFTEIVELFGAASFLPTSRLRRAPSKPTGANKFKTLSEEQIQALRQELQEVLSTESSYVAKIGELATVVAPQFTSSAGGISIEHAKAIAQLFPPSLSSIHDANSQFLNRLNLLFQDSEKSIVERDPTGCDVFAKLLLDTLPSFREPYINYIKCSSTFSASLSALAYDAQSPLGQELQQIGEQKLRSWLIEPVQRLPRYALFIESITKRLPISHPAIPKLLRAKDLIGEILDAEEADTDMNAKTLRRLRSLVLNWPSSLDPGRLITSADVVELKAPYAYHPRIKDESQGLLLLFPNHVLLLRKTGGNTLSARGLMAEIDRPSMDGSHTKQQPTLSLAYTFRLSETRFTESSDGRLIHLGSVKNNSSRENSLTATTLVFALCGSYEGKAAKWNEDIARARIEYRFPERIREDARWGLRTIDLDKTGLGLYAAVFEHDGNTKINNVQAMPGRIRVLVRNTGEDQEWISNLDTVEINATIIQLQGSRYRLEIRGSEDNLSTDNVHADDLMAVFIRRLSNLQRFHHQPTTATMAYIQTTVNQKVAETIKPTLPAQPELRSSRFRPISPVKVLSSFLGGIREQTSYNKLPTLERTSSKQSFRSVKDLKPGLGFGTFNTFESPKAVAIAQTTHDEVEGAFVQLEKTLDTYIVALHSRCGNVVGKVIRSRASADELMINELYNVLLEDPTQYQATAEVPVDVLFAAFEIFLNRAWKDKMGPLLPSTILVRLDNIFLTQASSQLEAPFKTLLQEMTPQNQRAFSALTKLLYDLLDASGNDGDRGAITAAFAEAMFQGSNYQNYIPLLDRMVENLDVLFEDVVIPEAREISQANSGGRRNKATTPGSVSSATSSFKKRFGFGALSREYSKNDSESRVGQMIRNLSKKSTGDSTSQPSSLSKAFLTRSKSIDTENRRPFFSRPGSSSGKGTPTASLSRPTSSHRATPDIVAPMANLEISRGTMARRKRRSSLSDITSLQNNLSSEFSNIIRPRALDKPADSIAPFQEARGLPQTPSPTKSIMRSPMSPDPVTKIPSPSSMTRLASPSPTRKENIPPSSPTERISQKPQSDVSKTLGSPKKRDLNSTQIPSLKPGTQSTSTSSPQRSVLSPATSTSPRRKASGSPQRVASGSPQRRVLSGSPQRKNSAQQKLRMQSPQKLRERLEREKKAIDEAGPALKLDLNSITEHVAANASSSRDLRQRVEALEGKLTTTLSELGKRNASIQADVESSLMVSERKAKSLDDEFRVVNAENELLYEKFNGELMKIVDAVKAGSGVQELKEKLKEAQDEASRLRKENQRLKRENLGLRSQLR